MRVLIIESDAAFASTLRQALEARGVEVRITSDGKDAIELARGEPPVAIVLSVELGDRLTGGFAWCNRFKRDPELRSIPLLLTSSLATEETFEQHRKLKTRADDYLLKPYGPRELLDWLEPYLPRPPAPDEDQAPIDLARELLDGLDDEPFIIGSRSPSTNGIDVSAEDELVGSGVQGDEAIFLSEEIDLRTSDEALGALAEGEGDEAFAAGDWSAWEPPTADGPEAAPLFVAEAQEAAAAGQRSELSPAAESAAPAPLGVGSDTIGVEPDHEPGADSVEDLDGLGEVDLFDTEELIAEIFDDLEDEPPSKAPAPLEVDQPALLPEQKLEAEALRVEAVEVSELRTQVEELLEKNSALQAELDQARAARDSFEARGSALEEELARLRGDLLTKSEEVERLEAARADAEARSEEAAGNLEDVARTREQLRASLAAAVELLDELGPSAPQVAQPLKELG